MRPSASSRPCSDSVVRHVRDGSTNLEAAEATVVRGYAEAGETGRIRARRRVPEQSDRPSESVMASETRGWLHESVVANTKPIILPNELFSNY